MDLTMDQCEREWEFEIFYLFFIFFMGLMLGRERGVRDWESLENEFERVFFFFLITKYYQIRIPFKFIQIVAYSFHERNMPLFGFFFFFYNRIFWYIATIIFCYGSPVWYSGIYPKNAMGPLYIYQKNIVAFDNSCYGSPVWLIVTL